MSASAAGTQPFGTASVRGKAAAAVPKSCFCLPGEAFHRVCVGCGNNKSLLHKELCLTSPVGITLVSVILAIYPVSLTTNHLEKIWHSFLPL